MTTRREDPRRRRLLGRRPPAVHRPVLPAPETPAEVLERSADDVSRETSVGPYVAGGQVPPTVDPCCSVCAEIGGPHGVPDPPPLRKDQVARLEALTAVWERQVRLEGPADATMLYTGASRPPVPPVVSHPRQFGKAAPGTPPPSLAPAEEVPPARASSWASRHDPRSRAFALRDRLRVPVPLRDVLLEHGPILDQGTTPPLSLREASACTGMAAVAAANVLERHRLSPAGPVVDRTERDALEAYELAQDLDERAGHDYAGTSVLAVMKAGQQLGWWGSYLWALAGTRDVAQALLQFCVPVVLGLPWPAGMESPDAAGIVRPTGAAGMGHALTVVGLLRQLTAGQLEVADRPQAGVHFILQQSRGTSEGAGGLVYLHHRDLAQLLAGSGEAAVPLPA